MRHRQYQWLLFSFWIHQGVQSRQPERYASTVSSRRCEHICLPRLPLNHLQELLPPRGGTRYAKRSDRDRGNVGSSICGNCQDITGSMLARSADELIVNDSGLHARKHAQESIHETLPRVEIYERGVCQNRSTKSLHDGQGHDINQATPRTIQTTPRTTRIAPRTTRTTRRTT